MREKTIPEAGEASWFFFRGGPGAPRYGDDPTKHAVDHDTETFVREVLQNANDQRLSEKPVEVAFKFESLSGSEKRSFLNALGWNGELGDRIEAVASSDHVEGYDRLEEQVEDPDEELRLLTVEDRNTTGLTGSWDEDTNYAALVRDELYSSKQDETAGGSYGLGKSVLWTFSELSTVVFNSYPSDTALGNGPRLIGRTKLPTHDFGEAEQTYQGAGWLCEPDNTNDGIRPQSLWGEDAERMAEKLRVQRTEDSGTSAMVVGYRDPKRDTRPDLEELADEVVEAAVKYFWPAICQGDLNVTVETPEEHREVDVRDVPSIRPFVESFAERETAEEQLSSPGDIAALDIPVELPPRADGSETPSGMARLAVRMASPADDETYLNRVALFRGSGMVVKYLDQSRVAYGDRTFHAVLAAGEARTSDETTEGDLEVDRFLRFSEPPEHNEWESTEKLRDRYFRGYRTALDDMFDTLRDALRHLITETRNGHGLSDRVMKRFPIHGGKNRRGGGGGESPFEIDGESFFDTDRWRFTGRIEPKVDELESWAAEISLTGVGEDGSRYDDLFIDGIDVDKPDIDTVRENGVAKIVSSGGTGAIEFEGATERIEGADLRSGRVGETQLEIRAEMNTSEDSDE